MVLADILSADRVVAIHYNHYATTEPGFILANYSCCYDYAEQEERLKIVRRRWIRYIRGFDCRRHVPPLSLARGVAAVQRVRSLSFERLVRRRPKSAT